MANIIMIDDTYRRVKEKRIRDLWEKNQIDSEKAVYLIQRLNKVLNAAQELNSEKNLFESMLIHAEEPDDDTYTYPDIKINWNEP